jgi:chromosome segregation ATPase
MSALEEPIKNIEQKLKEVTRRYSALKNENLRLQAEVQRLNDINAQKEEELQQLRHQTDVLKSGIQNWQPEQRKLFVKRIDAYLKEIDKCIALLNE